MSVLKQDNGFGDALLRVVSLQALHAEKSSNCILPFLVHEKADFYFEILQHHSSSATPGIMQVLCERASARD